jgi:phospholipase/carboxylesterase
MSFDSVADAAPNLGRLTARPGTPTRLPPPAAGLHALALHASRDTLLFVPQRLAPEPLPLAVLLHGAGGDANRALPYLTAESEQHGFLVLVPQSHAHTWDLIVAQYGPDVAQLDRALARVFDQFAVDPRRLAVAGFSDGASYALSLGLLNGDLFSHVLAFSPGFALPAPPSGRPSIFISHGLHDRVLPIERCGRHVAQALMRERYAVDYVEFQGGHEVPAPIVAEAMAEWLGGM